MGSADAAVKYRAAPEVFWFSIFTNGKRSGFGRGEYTRGEAAPYQFQNLILMDLPGGMRVAERSWWEFEPDLKPANFFRKTIAWKAGQSFTNTVDGLYDYPRKKLAVEYAEFGANEKVDIDLPANHVARYTQNLVLAASKLKPGMTFNFHTFSIKDRRFVDQQIKVKAFDKALNAWRLEGTSEEAPGSVSTTWFQTASAAHPNGWTVKSTQPAVNQFVIELRPASRAQAIEGYEKEAAALGI